MRNTTHLSLIISAALLASAAAAQEPTDRPQQAEPDASAGARQSTDSQPAQTRSDAERAQGDRTRTAEADRKDSDEMQQRSTTTSTTTTTPDRQRQAAAGDQSGAARSQGGATVPFITVLVPIALETRADTGLANGCWAKLYGENGFRGDSLTLVGPVDMQDMKGPFGVQWDDKVSSIKAGPNATVTIYDDTNYRDKAATVRPREQVQEISEKMGLFEDVESLKVSCSGSSG